MEKGSPANPRDEDLVAMCQGGERQAFDILVRRYMQRAYHIAFDFTHDCEEAKDLSQDAFLRAFSQIKHFDQKSTFYTWFYRIVVNLCLDHNRRRRRIPWERLDEKTKNLAERREMIGVPPSPDQVAMAEEVKRRLGMTLEALPKKQRTAFVLRNHQGLSIPEIAKVMQTTEGTVRVYLHRAVAALRQSLVELV